MPRDSFPTGVAERLKWYVYRLIDPRNGETFYVGKGKANRIFAHAKADYTATISQGASALHEEDNEDASDLKMKRINEIRAAGLEVGHVVHQHGIEQEKVAYQVEAALIDAYPGLTNLVEGRGSRDYGTRHVEEIVAQYAAEEFVVRESLLLIFIGRYLHVTGDPYDSVRCHWRVNVDRARGRLVLAQADGKVVGAYRPSKWIPATRANFPGRVDEDFVNPLTDKPTRWGFVGEPAANEVWSLYVGKRVPDQYRGSQNPVQYCEPCDVQVLEARP